MVANNHVHEMELLNERFNLNELKQAIKSAKNDNSPGDDKLYTL